MDELIPNEIPKRPQNLSILCILTFIGSGLSVISNGLVVLFYEPFTAAENLKEIENIFGSDMNLDVLLGTSIYYYALQTVFYALSVWGAYRMWKLQKIGFHLYTFAQMVILILPEIFVPALPFPFVQLLVTASFVFLYYSYTRMMN